MDELETLNALQAYRAMFAFLERYYERTHADEIGALLGSMALLEDGKPMDEALWRDWTGIVAEMRKN